MPQSIQSLIIREKNPLLAPSIARKECCPWNTQLPTSPPRKRQRPVPYFKNLFHLPSPLHPHCPASQRLCLQQPLVPHSSHTSQVSNNKFRCIEAVMAHAWEPDTHTTYASGLLNYMVFCNKKDIPESDRALVSQLLLMSFISTLAAAYSGLAISNYVCGIWAWHILHGVSWRIKKLELELDALLKVVEKLISPSLKRKKQCPYTVDFMLAIQQHLDLSTLLGTSVFTCLTTCFFTMGHIREFTVQRLDSFNPNTHISWVQVSFNQSQEGQRVTVLHISHTKVSQQGEDVCWVKQDGPMDPDAALAHHLEVNNPPQEGHLFAYHHKNKYRSLTKSKFLTEPTRATCCWVGASPRPWYQDWFHSWILAKGRPVWYHEGQRPLVKQCVHPLPMKACTNTGSLHTSSTSSTQCLCLIGHASHTLTK